jgi:hypothetical protein
VSEIAKWSSRNRWVGRADAYWLYVERKLREERENEISRTNRSHAQLGQIATSLALQRLTGHEDPDDPTKNVRSINPNELSPRDVAQLGKFGVEVTRLAQGQATSLAKGAVMLTGAEAAKAFSDLCEIALHHIPDDRKPLFAEEVRAFASGERRMLEA